MSETAKNGVEQIRSMANRLEQLRGEIQSVQGMAGQVRESAQVIKAFEARQKEAERAAWREAVREAARQMLCILPEMNIPSWEEGLNGRKESEKGFLGIPKTVYKEDRRRVYPIAYLGDGWSKAIAPYKEGRPQAMIEVLLVDEEGNLWQKECVGEWAFSNHGSISFDSNTSLSLAKSREDMQEIWGDKVKEADSVEDPVIRRLKHQILSMTGAEILIHQSGSPARPWDHNEKCASTKKEYEGLLKSITELFEKHKAWMHKRVAKISEVVEGSGSKTLGEMAPVPTLPGRT